mgnify:CR=1 FL=1
MPKYLFIAEKPSLARSIQDAYNTLKSPTYSADIVPLRGHFMELQEPEDYTSDWGIFGILLQKRDLIFSSVDIITYCPCIINIFGGL